MSAVPLQQIDVVSGPQGCTLHLAGSIGIMLARELHAASLGLLRAEGSVTVHCERVEHLDFAALQVLVALQQELGRRSRGMEMAAVPIPVERYLRLAGLQVLTPAAP